MRFLFVFLLGLILGAAALYYYQQHPATSAAAGNTASDLSASARDATARAVAKTRAVASDVSDALAQKIQDWHLTPADIHADLARSGQVARENAGQIGDRVADARIISVIKAKLVLDRELQASAISVDCKDGAVTLTGTVANESLVGRAVALAMDTTGVRHVTARLQPKP